MEPLLPLLIPSYVCQKRIYRFKIRLCIMDIRMKLLGLLILRLGVSMRRFTNMAIEWDMGTLVANTKALSPKLDKGIGVIMDSQSSKVQDYARTHAPWTDRTSNARNGLFAKY